MKFLSTFEIGDRLWEQLKRRSPRLQAADATDDQTHVHHTLVCILLFGGAAMLGATVFTLWMFGFASAWVFTSPLAFGIAIGWGFYIVRELVARLHNWRYKVWDGVCDVIVPMAWTSPWVLGALTRGADWWSGALMYGGAAAVALLYFVFRPVPKSA